MKTMKWIFAIAIASLTWMACDEDDDNPLNKPELNDADEGFVEFAARSNMGEIELGELAVTKGADSLVRAFAQQMIDEHTTAQNELKDLADDYEDIDWPDDLSDQQDSIRAALNDVSGHTFDTLYMRTQMVMHERTAQNFRATAMTGTDTRVKGYANKYLPHIEMHLEMADSIHTVLPERHMDDGGTADEGTMGDGTTDGGTN